MAISTFIRDLKNMNRLRQVIDCLFKHEMGFLIKKFNLTNGLSFHKRIQKNKLELVNTHPKTIANILDDLGGGFIKLAQFLSLREDLIPKEYCDEFRNLQDNVSPFSTVVARTIIKEELGKDVDELFKTFPEEPIASASIGQVYKVETKKGEILALKIQRPKIRQILEQDLEILYKFAELAEKHFRGIKATTIVKELERYSRNETDYAKEAKNCDIIHNNFRKDKTVKIPKVYWDFTKGRVLALEYINGTKVSEAKLTPAQKTHITKLIVDSIFKQVFIDGFFHADPHPGNIFVINANKISYLDFGIVGWLDDESKEKVSNLFVSLITADIPSIIDAMMDLNIVTEDISVSELKTDLFDGLSKYHNTPLKEIKIGEVMTTFFRIVNKYDMAPPRNLVLLGKSIITVDGMAKQLSPEFNLVANAKPFVDKLIREKTSPKASASRLMATFKGMTKFIRRFPGQTHELLKRINEGDKGIERIEKDITRLTTEVDKSTNRLVMGILLASFIIYAALISTVNQPRIYGIPALSIIGYLGASFVFIMLMISVIREKRILR